MKYTKEEYELVRKYIQSVILRCEKIQPKFQEGTAQSTLLINRVFALNVVDGLIHGDSFTIEVLERALPPVISILHKCKKAQAKYEIGTTQYKRFEKQIYPMQIAKVILEDTIKKMNNL